MKQLQAKAYIFGSFISAVAGFDYFCDIRYLEEVNLEGVEPKDRYLVISRKSHEISPTKLRNQKVLMMYLGFDNRNPVTQKHLVTKVEKIAHDEVQLHNSIQSTFEIRMPQGTFYARMKAELPTNKYSLDFSSIHSVALIVGYPLLIL